LLSYGIKDQDNNVDDKGNPVPMQDGIARSAFFPWQYIARRPHVKYQADLPGFAKASHEAQQVIMPLGVEDPTRGYYSPTAHSGRLENRSWRPDQEGVRAGHGRRLTAAR